MGRIRVRVSLLVMLALITAAGAMSRGITVAADNDCSHKCAEGMLTPSSLAAGATTTIGFTLTNEAHSFALTNNEEHQSLGSANLVAPSGFVLPPSQSPPALSNGSASISSDGTTLELRDLNLPSGATLTVDFEVTTTCASQSGSWSLTVKQANDFNGEGNDFAIDPRSQLATMVSGSCSLLFSAEPANALVNTNISSEGFQLGGAPVAVEAEDGMGNPVTGVTVTVSLVPGGGAGTLSGSLSNTTDTSGMATFGSPSAPLAINQTGYYQLQATATGFSPAASGSFQISGTAKTCSANPCSTSSSSKSTQAFSTAVNEQTGDLLSLGLGGFAYSCDNSSQGLYVSVSQPVGTDVWLAGGSAIDTTASGKVTIEILRATAKTSPNHSTAAFQICYASTVPFAPRPGTSILTTTAPGPIALYYGLLPDCGHARPAPVPCVLSRFKEISGDIVISFDGNGDFWGQG